MTCLRCNSDRLFQFEASSDPRVKVKNLPLVCRTCGLVMIDGAAAAFPPEFEATAKALAEVAAEAGNQAIKDLSEDHLIADYFNRVYRDAYLDGFWRAWAFARHNQKEGRLKRLRSLWTKRVIRCEDHPIVLEMDKTVYAEFKQLLELGDTDAPRTSD
jgi:hypothetical protein